MHDKAEQEIIKFTDKTVTNPEMDISQTNSNVSF